MKPSDRDYFLRRAHQEHDAAARTTGAARSRHEELASSYRMRVLYIDRGLIGEQAEEVESRASVPPAEIMVPA